MNNCNEILFKRWSGSPGALLNTKRKDSSTTWNTSYWYKNSIHRTKNPRKLTPHSRVQIVHVLVQVTLQRLVSCFKQPLGNRVTPSMTIVDWITYKHCNDVGTCSMLISPRRPGGYYRQFTPVFIPYKNKPTRVWLTCNIHQAVQL